MLTPAEALIAGAMSDNNPFVEAVTYTPSGGTAVEINAVVQRESGTVRRSGIDNRSQYKAEIIISSDATSGIADVTPRKDTVSMAAPELGNSTSHTFLVAAIIGKSAMGWHLGLSQ